MRPLVGRYRRNWREIEYLPARTFALTHPRGTRLPRELYSGCPGLREHALLSVLSPSALTFFLSGMRRSRSCPQSRTLRTTLTSTTFDR